MFSQEGLAVLRGNTPLPPLFEYHISALGQFPLVLVFPRLLARCVTGRFVFSRASLNQRLGNLTKRGYLCGGGGMIGLSRGGERRSLLPCQYLIAIPRGRRTSLDICAEINCIFLDVDARPFCRLAKPDWASVAREFAAVTLAFFTDDSCLRAAVGVIST